MDADEGAGAAMGPGEDAGTSAGRGAGVDFRAGGEAGGAGRDGGDVMGGVLPLGVGEERKGAQAGTVATGAGGNAQSIEGMDGRAGGWAGAGADVAESVHTGGVQSGSPYI